MSKHDHHAGHPQQEHQQGTQQENQQGNQQMNQQQANQGQTASPQDFGDVTRATVGDPGEGAQSMIKSAASAGEQISSRVVGGVATVATDLVHGVGDLGEEVVVVVRDTAMTAIEGVGSVGESAVHAITGLLAELVGGVRDVGAAAMRGRSANAHRSERAQEPSTTEEAY